MVDAAGDIGETLGAAAEPGTPGAGEYDASHVASRPAPETTAVDFQVM